MNADDGSRIILSEDCGPNPHPSAKKGKNVKRKFRCDCRTHIVEVQYDEDKIGKKISPTLWIDICDLYNPDTGRKYKKPRSTGDAVLMNNAYPKELEKFLKFMEEIIKKYRLSQK